jgi:hypothetical protein
MSSAKLLVTPLFVAFLLAVGACGAPRRDANLATRPTPAHAARFIASLGELESATGADHVAVLHAFRALGETLQSVAPHRVNEIVAFQNTCATLERAAQNPSAHADFVRIGLAAATDALSTLEPTNRAQYASSLAAMTDAMTSVDPNRRLGDQYPQVRAALRAASRIVLAAR